MHMLTKWLPGLNGLINICNQGQTADIRQLCVFAEMTLNCIQLLNLVTFA